MSGEEFESSSGLFGTVRRSDALAAYLTLQPIEQRAYVEYRRLKAAATEDQPATLSQVAEGVNKLCGSNLHRNSVTRYTQDALTKMGIVETLEERYAPMVASVPGYDAQVCAIDAVYAGGFWDGDQRDEAHQLLVLTSNPVLDYARLDDALAGLPRRFARQDVVEQTWRIIQPALDNPGPVHPYFRGSWGPSEADRILHGDSWLPISS